MPFSEEEIRVIDSLHEGMDALRETAGLSSGPIRRLEEALVFTEGHLLENRERTLKSLREGRQHLEEAIEIAEEEGIYRSNLPTLFKMREDFGKVLPDEVEERRGREK